MRNGPDFIINLKTLSVCLFTLNICLGDLVIVFIFPQAANRNLMIQTQVLVNKDITGNGPLSHFVQIFPSVLLKIPFDVLFCSSGFLYDFDWRVFAAADRLWLAVRSALSWSRGRRCSRSSRWQLDADWSVGWWVVLPASRRLEDISVDDGGITFISSSLLHFITEYTMRRAGSI